MGTGCSREAYIIPWEILKKKYLGQDLKLTVKEIRDFPEIRRDGKDYRVDPEEWDIKSL